MSKRQVFIVPGGLQLKLDTEAGVFARLDSDEAHLLQQYPRIDEMFWRLAVRTDATREAEYRASVTLDCLRALRKALQDATTPAWEAAALGMGYQDEVTRYLQPRTASAIGAAHARDKQPRRPDDELALRVLRCLRRKRHLTWKQSLRALQYAAENETAIEGIGIERTGENRWTFIRKREGRPDQVEPFTTSTLRDKKFRQV